MGAITGIPFILGPVQIEELEYILREIKSKSQHAIKINMTFSAVDLSRLRKKIGPFQTIHA